MRSAIALAPLKYYDLRIHDQVGMLPGTHVPIKYTLFMKGNLLLSARFSVAL